uniref:FLZ-type domain-containing protein n=3 Tax=Aegilops tauschii TaxID=37682 RepID=A0A453CXF6_AEGTS
SGTRTPSLSRSLFFFSRARRRLCSAQASELCLMACAFFFDAEPVGEPGVHALDACALCTKPLARDSDIFMYRVDTTFCSDECRHEQMQLDAACARQAAARRQKQFSSGTGSGRAHREASVAS